MTAPNPVADDVSSLAGLLRDALRRNAGRPAVRDARQSWTYDDLAEHSERFAAGLLRAGVRGGDRVVCLLPSTCEAVALLYATVRIGAVFVPLDCQTTVYRLRWLLADAEPALVVADAPGRALVRESSTIEPVAPEDLAAPRSTDSTGLPIPACATPAPDAVALMMYTSGTTAHPRAVVCPADRVLFAVRAIAARLAYQPTDVVLCRPPLSFDYGLYQVLLCADAGAQLVLAEPGDDATLLATISRTGVSVLPLVPTLATLLCQLGERRGSVSGVRMATNTGAALTAPTAAWLRRTLPGAGLVFMYGMTECKRISISEPDDDLRHPGSVGPALAGTAVRVVGPHGEPLPPGRLGEIVVTGPHVMAGYWHAPEQSAQRFRPDLYTGDQGRLDATGRLYIAGRRDDLFKRHGVRTSRQEIESALLDLPGVEAAAAALDQDGDLIAWVVADRAENELRAGVAQRLGFARTPDRCVVLPRLPTTANGKVDRAALLGLGRSAAR